MSIHGACISLESVIYHCVHISPLWCKWHWNWKAHGTFLQQWGDIIHGNLHRSRADPLHTLITNHSRIVPMICLIKVPLSLKHKTWFYNWWCAVYHQNIVFTRLRILQFYQTKSYVRLCALLMLTLKHTVELFCVICSPWPSVFSIDRHAFCKHKTKACDRFF